VVNVEQKLLGLLVTHTGVKIFLG